LESALFLPVSIFATTLWLLNAAWYGMMTPWLRHRVLTSSKFPEAVQFHLAFNRFSSFTEGFVRLAGRNTDAAWVASAIVPAIDGRFQVQVTVPLKTALLGLFIYPIDAPRYSVFQLREMYNGDYDIAPGGLQATLPKEAGDMIFDLADPWKADDIISLLMGGSERPDQNLALKNSKWASAT
jgi:hypothetical protein